MICIKEPCTTCSRQLERTVGRLQCIYILTANDNVKLQREDSLTTTYSDKVLLKMSVTDAHWDWIEFTNIRNSEFYEDIKGLDK